MTSVQNSHLERAHGRRRVHGSRAVVSLVVEKALLLQLLAVVVESEIADVVGKLVQLVVDVVKVFVSGIAVIVKLLLLLVAVLLL